MVLYWACWTVIWRLLELATSRFVLKSARVHEVLGSTLHSCCLAIISKPRHLVGLCTWQFGAHLAVSATELTASLIVRLQVYHRNCNYGRVSSCCGTKVAGQFALFPLQKVPRAA